VICILETIRTEFYARSFYATGEESRSGPGVQGLREMKIERFEDIEMAKET